MVPDSGVTFPVKAFLVVFLAAFVAAGVTGGELWPLTGWRLFSQARGAEQGGWQAVTVDRDGRETEVPFGELPRGYSGAQHVMAGFASLGPAGRRGVCDAWAEAVRLRGAEVVAVRIYRARTDVRSGALVGRTLAHDCSGPPAAPPPLAAFGGRFRS